MVGNDMFASHAGVASHAANEALYRAHPAKPYSLPEWGLSIDDPGFVKRICAFLKTRPRTKLAAYYDARPGSPYDLGSKPASRAEYRRCITPLGTNAGVRPPGPPTSAQLRLIADPVKGDAPLDVTFVTHVNLPKPVLHWELAFGDGKVLQRDGPPPTTVTYTYPKDGVYAATLTVYLERPFTVAAIRHVTQAQVKVGKKADEPLRLARGTEFRQGAVLGQLPRGPDRARDELGLRLRGRHEPVRPGQAATLPRTHLYEAGDLSRRPGRPSGAERAGVGVRRRAGALDARRPRLAAVTLL